MSCYKSSNNKKFKCPPRMDDGRHFTDYRANCHVNNLVRANNKILNSHEYRMFLTHNAKKIMDFLKKPIKGCKKIRTLLEIPFKDRIISKKHNYCMSRKS